MFQDSEYVERFNQFMNFGKKLNSTELRYDPDKKWAEQLTELKEKVEASKTTLPADQKNLSTNLRNEAKSKEILQNLKNRFEKSQKYIEEFSAQEFAKKLKEFTQTWKDLSTSLSRYNTQLKEVENYYSQEYKEFETAYNRYITRKSKKALEGINNKIQEETSTVQTLQRELKEINKNGEITPTNINQQKEDIDQLKKYLGNINEEMKVVDKKSREIIEKQLKNISPELRQSFKAIKAEIQRAEQERDQIQKNRRVYTSPTTSIFG